MPRCASRMAFLMHIQARDVRVGNLHAKPPRACAAGKMPSVAETNVRASRPGRVPQGVVPVSIQVNLLNRFGTPMILDLDASRCGYGTRFSFSVVPAGMDIY